MVACLKLAGGLFDALLCGYISYLGMLVNKLKGLSICSGLHLFFGNCFGWFLGGVYSL